MRFIHFDTLQHAQNVYNNINQTLNMINSSFLHNIIHTRPHFNITLPCISFISTCHNMLKLPMKHERIKLNHTFSISLSIRLEYVLQGEVFFLLQQLFHVIEDPLISMKARKNKFFLINFRGWFGQPLLAVLLLLFFLFSLEFSRLTRR